jgi:hypothetical protein
MYKEEEEKEYRYGRRVPDRTSDWWYNLFYIINFV